MKTGFIFFVLFIMMTLSVCTNNFTQNNAPASQSVSAAQSGDPGAVPPAAVSGTLTVSLDYEKQSGSASNQYAVWIEDMDGALVKTLYASQWTARGGYKTRPDSIAIWAQKSGLASMAKAEADAVSGATPKAGPQTYTWVLDGTAGNVIPPGKYRFFVEGTLRWKNYVLYSGVIDLDSKPASAQAEPEYVYAAVEKYAALTGDSPENKMIGAVTASFEPF